jgi:hypothetical protein
MPEHEPLKRAGKYSSIDISGRIEPEYPILNDLPL